MHPPFPKEQRHLRLSIRHQPTGYEVQSILTLPTDTLVAQSKSHFQSYQPLLDEVADRLVEEIRRHKERIRHDRVYRRKRHRQNEEEKVVGIASEADLLFKERPIRMPLYLTFLGSIIYLEPLDKFKQQLKKKSGSAGAGCHDSRSYNCHARCFCFSCCRFNAGKAN